MNTTDIDTQTLVGQPIAHLGEIFTIASATTIDVAYVGITLDREHMNRSRIVIDTVDQILRAMKSAGAWADDPGVWDAVA